MNALAYTCPKCLANVELDAGAKFCPRCGMQVETDSGEPMTLSVAGHNIEVRGRFALGDLCNMYECRTERPERKSVFKIARDAVSNRHVVNEATILGRLHRARTAERFGAFVPRVLTSLTYTQPGEPDRQANVLVYHPEIASPTELYTLEEVRNAYPAGLDPRDMAWMWRRLLTVMGFIHDQGIVHTALTPDHVLIEPREHKLIIIGWCGAAPAGAVPTLQPARWRDWGSWSSAASSTTDFACAARSMQHLLGSNVEPAIARHLERAAESSSSVAWKLLDDFDRMIEALWGPRQFRPFNMPARRV